MYSFRDNDPQEEQFTLRVKEKPKHNLCKTVSSICHSLIYSIRNDTLIKSHNNFTTKYDICYDDSSIDPPNKYLTDYARAIAICEDFFVKTPLKHNNPEEYKQVLLDILKYEFTPSFDCVLLSQIGNYIDYYVNKEKVNKERLSFKLQTNREDTIRDKVANLREQVAIMDLDFGYNHFAIRKKRKLKQKRMNMQDKSTNRNNILVTISDNNDTRKTSQSLEKNILIKNVMQKKHEKGLSRNYSQPVIDIKSSFPNKNPLLNSSCNNELNQQTKHSTVQNLNETNHNGNCNTIISNIFTSIYQPTPKIFIHKHKLSDKQDCKTINTVHNDNNINNNSVRILSNQRSFNESTNTQLKVNHYNTKLKTLPKLPSFIDYSHKDKYNKLSANYSLQNLNPKDNRLVSSLRSQTTNNTLTLMKTTTKRTNRQTRNYSKETNKNFVKTSMLIMKQYQNSLRKDTSVPNYKPNKKKVSKMAPLVGPKKKHKEIIPYVYHINRKPIMHLKDYAIKQPNHFTNDNNSNNVHQRCSGKKEKDYCDIKLRKIFISVYIKLNHNILLLILFKTATAYNRSLNSKRRKKSVLCSNDSSKNNKRNMSRNNENHKGNISIKEISDKSQRELNNNKSMQTFKSFAKNTSNTNQRLPFK